MQWHEEQIAAARTGHAQAIVFPELSLTGYYLRDIVPDVAMAATDPLLTRLAAAAESVTETGASCATIRTNYFGANYFGAGLAI